MKAGQTTLKRLIEGERQYRIPQFQRPYTWEVKQLKQLWDDLLAQYEVLGPESVDAHPGRSTHFLGSFVLTPMPGLASGVSAFQVVDGQQRLTTLFLALAALRDALKGRDPDAAERYERIYLRNQDRYDNVLDQYKLLPSRSDREPFFACMDGRAGDDASKVTAAYRYFVSQLAKEAPEGNGSALDFELMKQVIVERLSVVDITTEADDNAHRIFESLNYRGVNLTQADLLRNYIFMLLPTRAEEVHDQIWVPMERSLGAENLEGLARVDLLRRGVDATKDDVYRLHQERLEPFARDESRIVEEVRDLARQAGFYKRLVDPGAEPDLDVRAGLARLNRWGAQTTYPLLMHIYGLIDAGKATAANLSQTLAYIESFIVRRHLARVPTNQLNRLFADMIKQLDPSLALPDAVRKELSGARRYWPTDDQIRQVVRTEPFYLIGRYPQRTLILERIESSYGHREPVDVAHAKLSIEHILPQTLSDEWREQLAAGGYDPDEIHNELLHTIGNLTLTAYNGELSNNPFERKRQIYSDSNLALNRSLRETEVWGRHEILERADELADRIIEIWPAPVEGARGAPMGFDWARIDAAVAAIPAGRWTTYGELAELGGTSAQAVGNRMGGTARLPNAYRVLDRTGRISPTFHWNDADDTRDVGDVLRGEGIAFDGDGVADPAQRLTAYALALLIPYEFEEEELEQLKRSDTAGSRKSRSVDSREEPWLLEGRAWHLEQRCSPKTRAIVETLVALVARAAPQAPEPNWAQKNYVSWPVGAGRRAWLRSETRMSWAWLSFRQAPCSAEEVAHRLGFQLIPKGAKANWANEGPSQVFPGDDWAIHIQFRNHGDVIGEIGQRLEQLLREGWQNLRGLSEDDRPRSVNSPYVGQESEHEVPS
ncbi:MAG: hypothetical protein QOK05_595 [Chloroflexota bacterium]|jgi:alkylated DNA nucleotide flippase Atl1|nr:hypothetical protein [Chloroflexota bacterium]